MYKFFFLINPVSGGGQGKSIYNFLPEIMESMGFDSEQWKADFTQIENLEVQIQGALSSTETLIAVGGDGTVSAVLSTMLDYDFYNKVKIGLIPLGTGNDLARVLNLYKPFTDKGFLYLLRRLLLAKAKPFDIWKVNGKLAMANYFSSGIDARIAHDFNRDRAQGVFNSNSVLTNKIHYVKSFFADRSYRLRQGSLRYVDQYGQTQAVLLENHRTVIVGNIPSFASGTNPFYQSKVSDKLLEVVRVPNLADFLLAIAIGNIPVVGHFFKKYFLKSTKVKSLELEIPEDEFLQLDGEDLTRKLGNKVTIDFACQVQMLTLPK
ncbi:MAG: diacylglycerol kinase [Fibrobacteraceae bacterium]|nr:diacylglycerol kinase [Fibrobacteraceae bacterium]